MDCGFCFPDGSMCGAPDDCCSGVCQNGVCGVTTPCVHDVCDQGVPLTDGCSACVSAVCDTDPSCCQAQGEWDEGCVAAAEGICGVDCNVCAPNGSLCMSGPDCCSGTCVGGVCEDACFPDGNMCSAFDQCCSNSCVNGTCESACSPDGSFCGDPDECCSGICIAGFCGPSECPSDGSPCQECIAQQCCSEILGCFGSPDCIDDVLCFLQCVQTTPQPVQCFFQCADDPQAFQTLACLGFNCATDCF